ncbi:MAG: T9SS type A sorting domain-containing protein [Bacteroidales bacterium]|nr:T9SS type A sorting domain-containing protein [Bacteroidales bacterium]
MKTTLITLLVSAFTLAGYAQNLPNGGFETWENLLLYEDLVDWKIENSGGLAENSGAIKSTDAYSGNFSIELKPVLVDEDSIFSFFYLGRIGDEGPGGGMIYTDAFNQVKGYYKADMAVDDSATIYIVKYYGDTPSETITKLGGVQSNWTEFTVDVTGGTADSVFIGFISSDIMFEDNMNFDSWIRFDHIFLENTSGTTPSALPNYDLENWMDVEYLNPEGWHTTNGQIALQSFDAVQQIEDAYSGNYAIHLETISVGEGYNIPGYLSIGELFFNDDNPVGSVPYTYQPTSMQGYYKYIPVGDSIGLVSIEMIAGGETIGGNAHQFEPQADWTYFDVPLSYSAVPEELRLIFTSGETVGSVLMLDDLSFDFSSDIKENKHAICQIYPNPATNTLYIQSAYEGDLNVKVLDIQSRLMKSVQLSGNGQIKLDISDLSPGVYLLTSDTSDFPTQKLIVK